MQLVLIEILRKILFKKIYEWVLLVRYNLLVVNYLFNVKYFIQYCRNIFDLLFVWFELYDYFFSFNRYVIVYFGLRIKKNDY